jgi:hypothetical protein
MGRTDEGKYNPVEREYGVQFIGEFCSQYRPSGAPEMDRHRFRHTRCCLTPSLNTLMKQSTGDLNDWLKWKLGFRCSLKA